MIHAVFYREGERIVEFSVSGHAGLAERGDDVVCAAVSALTQAALIGLEDVVGVSVDADVADEDGRLVCRLPAPLEQEQVRGASVLLETCLRSLRSIEAGYQDHVQVREVHRS